MKTKNILLLSLLILGQFLTVKAQETFPRNGAKDDNDATFAITNAHIYQNVTTQIESGTIVFKDGKIVAIGRNVSVPKGAITVDIKGQYVYPSFVELWSDYGMPEVKRGKWEPSPQYKSNKSGAYGWNEALKSDFNAFEAFKSDGGKAKSLRSMGFGVALSHRKDGISRGSGTLVLLGDNGEQKQLLKNIAAHVLSFQKGSSRQQYPSSLMGIMALLRQTQHDANWYANGGSKKERNLTLEAWNALKNQPQIITTGNGMEALRAIALGKDMKTSFIINGTGEEYQYLDGIREANAKMIIPINFPKAYDVSDPTAAQRLTLKTMRHWDLSPSNPKRLADANVTFAISSAGHKSSGDFFGHLRKAVENGLSKERALEALTITPARLIGVQNMAGSLEKGKLANFFVTNKDIFEKGAKVVGHWIGGEKHDAEKLLEKDSKQMFDLALGGQDYKVSLTKSSVSVQDTAKKSVKSSLKRTPFGFNGSVYLDKSWQKISAIQQGDKLMAKLYDANGKMTSHTGKLVSPESGKKKSDKKKASATVYTATQTYPLTAFGFKEKPRAETVLFKNATVWTNESDGIMKETDVLISNGEIKAIGKNLPAGGAKTIDATGLHLTPGMIDEHSHIAATRGINEGSQASTAEVRIGDILDSEDINIYRQLAGGVTTSQILHGSANPIGGQSALIKLRWGENPEGLKYKGAKPFIKFALGENVKQSNWGDYYRSRFPQTRMGVEQVYEDHFSQALQYKKDKQMNPNHRIDEEMETLLEIIEDKREITCHSYQQGEINMLMKVAEKYGFEVNTFTHILEGYKVADKMQKHGAGGSTFSDWWAYKYEVIDAIPYNGAILHAVGVLTAFNSDDAEMARRLNQEAGKAVMYGGVSEEEALKFVTLNPAKLLHIDDKVGSIKVGKSADVVLWSDHPLSVYAKAKMTFIDGKRYFDRDRDMELRKEVAAERNELIQKMMNEKFKTGQSQPVKVEKKMHYHCDTDLDEAH